MDKRSNLLQKFITYGRKKLHNIGPRALDWAFWDKINKETDWKDDFYFLASGFFYKVAFML
jgi:hypothetical protein